MNKEIVEVIQSGIGQSELVDGNRQGTIQVAIENKINWDFSQFNNGQVKYSQNIREFDKWLTWIKQEFIEDTPRPMKYLEIGSYAGESLFYMSQVLPQGSEITLVDLGDNHIAREILSDVIPYIQEKYEHKITLLSGFSDDPKILDEVANSAPFDMVFIDANHDFKWAFTDFMNYRGMADWIAFHDISEFNSVKTQIKYGRDIANANHVWKMIKVLVPEQSWISLDKDTDEMITEPNWVEFIDYDNETDISKMNLKPRGIGLLRSQW